ncbi:hypothetical protein BDR26DRAFT_355346 [Obelidium mucronatum]|nr:hypothetical protein BDR26DRAFT_355346 [Obelidium mucronatum]
MSLQGQDATILPENVTTVSLTLPSARKRRKVVRKKSVESSDEEKFFHANERPSDPPADTNEGLRTPRRTPKKGMPTRSAAVASSVAFSESREPAERQSHADGELMPSRSAAVASPVAFSESRDPAELQSHSDGELSTLQSATQSANECSQSLEVAPDSSTHRYPLLKPTPVPAAPSTAYVSSWTPSIVQLHDAINFGKLIGDVTFAEEWDNYMNVKYGLQGFQGSFRDHEKPNPPSRYASDPAFQSIQNVFTVSRAGGPLSLVAATGASAAVTKSATSPDGPSTVSQVAATSATAFPDTAPPVAAPPTVAVPCAAAPSDVAPPVAAARSTHAAGAAPTPAASQDTAAPLNAATGAPIAGPTQRVIVLDESIHVNLMSFFCPVDGSF